MSSGPLDQLERFTRLAFLRRRRALRDEERLELDGLLKRLCQQVEGFHPPSKRTRAPVGSPGTRGGARPPAGHGAHAPTAGEVDPFEETTEPPEAPTAAAPRPGTDIPPNVQSVDLGAERSAYTPKQQSVFLEDYYGADFVPDRTGELPKVVVDADGQSRPPTGDLQWFLRDPSAEEPEASVPSPPTAAPTPEAGPGPQTSVEAPRPKPKPQAAPSAIVHLRAGGSLRGRPIKWPPAEVLEVEGPKGPARVTFDELLAVFATGVQPRSLGAELKVEVTLSNDKKLRGQTMDYVRGAQSFTLVPDPKRPGVDVVWVPAHAVKGIRRY